MAADAGCPNLTTLKLHGCYRLYDDDALGLLRQCPALTSLSLEHAAELTGKTIEALADKILPQLQSLSLSGCAHLCLVPEDERGEPDTSEGAEIALEQLARPTMPQLTALDLSHNPALSPSTLSLILARHGGMLKDLNLLGCTELSAATLLEVATQCSDKLSHFKFIHQPPTAGAALAEPNAERQAIAELGEAVEALAEKCGGSLTALALEGCGPLLSDAAMAAVAERCGQGVGTLRQLSLNNASGLTDRTLVSLAAHTPGLTELDLSWCRKFTDEGLGHLTDRCEHLTSLRVWGCSQLTGAFLNGHRRHALQIIGRPSRPPLPPPQEGEGV
jgi:DNA repair protein RAD7